MGFTRSLFPAVYLYNIGGTFPPEIRQGWISASVTTEDRAILVRDTLANSSSISHETVLGY